MVEYLIDGTRRCWACAEPLKAHQDFCTECKQWQNWRRYTVFSATILALMTALLSVLGIVSPILSRLIYPPLPLLDLAVRVENVCELSGGCNTESDESSKRTHYILRLTNIGGKDVLLSKVMHCNTLIAGTLIETDDEFTSPTFFTKQSSFVKAGESSEIDYAHYTYQLLSPNFHAPRNMICAIAVDHDSGRYFAFTAIENEFFNPLGIVDLGRHFKNDQDLFRALKGE